jgi:ferritin-like metal-binding protein YciE
MADIKTLYATALRNTHALETQGLQQMERQVDGLERYPDYAAVLRAHIGTTKGQIARLESALSDLGESSSSFKDAVTGLAGTIGAAAHALAGDETLKNLYAGYAYQFDQIAAYRSLAVFAQTAGFPQHVAGFEQAVDEETRGADAVERLIEPVTQKYIALEIGGAKADS